MSLRQPQRQVRRRSAAHPRRLRLRGPASGIVSLPTCSTSPATKCARSSILGVNPSDRADRAQHPQLPVLGDRRLLPGRLEDPLEPDDQPRAPARVVRAAVRSERPADQHHSRSGQRHLRAGAHAPPWAAVDQVVPDDWNNFAPRLGLLVGSAVERHASPCAAATASPTSAVQQLDHQHPLQPAGLLVHQRDAGDDAVSRRAANCLRSDQSRWHARATSRSRSPARTATSACRPGSGSKATSSAGIPRFGTTHAVAARARSEHQGRLHARLVRRDADRDWRQRRGRGELHRQRRPQLRPARRLQHRARRPVRRPARSAQPHLRRHQLPRDAGAQRISRPAAPGEQALHARVLRSGVVHARQSDGRRLGRAGGRNAGGCARPRTRVGTGGLRRAAPSRDQLALGDPVLPRARAAWRARCWAGGRSTG